MKSIHDLEDFFSDKSLWLCINRPCLLPEIYVQCIYFGKKRGVICAVDFTYTRSLLDIFEWAVPASFLSYAPTFFGSNKYFLQNVCWKIFMYTYPWTQTECAHLNILNLLQTKCRWKLPYYRRTIFRQAPSSSHISGMKKNVWKSACGFSIHRLEDTSNFNGVSLDFSSKVKHRKHFRTLLFPASTGGHLDILQN